MKHRAFEALIEQLLALSERERPQDLLDQVYEHLDGDCLVCRESDRPDGFITRLFRRFGLLKRFGLEGRA